MFGLTFLSTAWEFLSSGTGKILGIVLGLVLLVGSSAFVYHSWSEGIREAERLRSENTTLKTEIVERDKTIRQLQAIADIQAAVSQNQTQDNETTSSKSGSITGWIGTQAGTKSDRESSQVLKDTFERLYEK
jgi:type II secretory pathway component PulM